MKITILTLFPEMFDGPFRESILKHAQQKGLVDIKLVNIRDFGEGRHKVVDDRPYGGGVGMVMRVDILDNALNYAKHLYPSISKDQQKTVLLDARGTTFTQKDAKKISQLDHLILLCGHYEGVDERARGLVDQTISLGDFITTGGEIPAMLIVDSVIRLIPGVLKEDATEIESFSIQIPHVIPAKAGIQRDGSRVKHGMTNSCLLEYPQYTIPREYNGKAVPNILLSGNHREIEKWRKEKSQE